MLGDLGDFISSAMACSEVVTRVQGRIQWWLFEGAKEKGSAPKVLTHMKLIQQ